MTTPQQFRDRYNDTWQRIPDGRLALVRANGDLSDICVFPRADVERIDGPLTELPSIASVADIPADKCGKCGQEAEGGIFVVVCRHVLEDDFDEDDEGERVPRIHVYAAPPSKGGATLHLCREADCPETELCAPCATNL